MDRCYCCGVKEATGRCKGCGVAALCSADCQLTYWHAGHSAECDIIGHEYHPDKILAQMDLDDADDAVADQAEAFINALAIGSPISRDVNDDHVHDEPDPMHVQLLQESLESALLAASADELVGDAFIEEGNRIADAVAEREDRHIDEDLLQRAIHWLDEHYEGPDVATYIMAAPAGVIMDHIHEEYGHVANECIGHALENTPNQLGVMMGATNDLRDTYERVSSLRSRAWNEWHDKGVNEEADSSVFSKAVLGEAIALIEAGRLARLRKPRTKRARKPKVPKVRVASARKAAATQARKNAAAGRRQAQRTRAAGRKAKRQTAAAARKANRAAGAQARKADQSAKRTTRRANRATRTERSDKRKVARQQRKAKITSERTAKNQTRKQQRDIRKKAQRDKAVINNDAKKQAREANRQAKAAQRDADRQARADQRAAVVAPEPAYVPARAATRPPAYVPPPQARTVYVPAAPQTIVVQPQRPQTVYIPAPAPAPQAVIVQQPPNSTLAYAALRLADAKAAYGMARSDAEREIARRRIDDAQRSFDAISPPGSQ